MAENRAAQELANLQQSTRLPVDEEAARQAAEDTKRGAQAGNVSISGEPGDAKFAAPEALATAIGAGFILGPVGGILLGVAQGILGKRMRQNALDEFAERSAAFDDMGAIVNEELNRMDAAALTEDDRDIVGGMMTQYDTAMRALKSQSPEVQELGAVMFQDLQGKMNEYWATQEVQRIEADATDAAEQRELEKWQYDKYKPLKERFESVAGAYDELMLSHNTAMAALNEGTPAQLSAAITKIAKALDPEGVVRPEDEKKWEALGSLKDRAKNFVEVLATGKGLNPEQRKDLQGLLTTIREEGNTMMLATEARYLEEALDLELPDKYLDNFTRVEDAPVVRAGQLKNTEETVDKALDAVDQANDPITTPIVNAAEWINTNLSDQAILDSVRNMGDAAAKKWLDIFVPDSVTADRPKTNMER